MYKTNESVLNRALVESFANSASLLREDNDTRILKLRNSAIVICRNRSHNGLVTYPVSVLDSNDNPVNNKLFNTSEEVRQFIIDSVSSEYALAGVSLKNLKKAIDNITYIKMYLYLRAFLENNCDHNYRQETRSIIDYDFSHDDITVDNVLDVTNKVLNDIRGKTYETFRNTSKDYFENADLDYDCFESEVFSVVNPCFPEWDVYGPHRTYMNEVDLPPVCETLLDKISSLFFNDPGDYAVVSYDLSGYEFSCASDEQLDVICRILDCYTVFEGEEELYSV